MSWTSLAYIDSQLVERISEGDLAAFDQALGETDRKIRGLHAEAASKRSEEMPPVAKG